MRPAIPLPILTAEQEVALARRVHGPDPADALAARNELVLSNLGLVGKAVVRYRRRRPVDPDDLFSEGVLALIRASLGFDPDRDCRFSTYATAAIRNQLRDYVYADTTVYVPRYLQDPQHNRRREAGGRKPKSQARLARNLARAAAATGGTVISLANPLPGDRDNDVTPPDTQPTAEQRAIDAEDVASIILALGTLPPMRAYVFAALLGLPDGDRQTAPELAAELGLTRSRIYQIEAWVRQRIIEILAPD